MKNLLILFFTFMPLLFFSQENNGLSFKKTNHDFGTITSNSNVKAIFDFTNTSDTTIEIFKIHGINRCIEIDSSSVRKYAPNEKGEIIVTYNSDCKGPIRKTLSIFTSKKDNTVSLKLSGKVLD